MVFTGALILHGSPERRRANLGAPVPSESVVLDTVAAGRPTAPLPIPDPRLRFEILPPPHHTPLLEYQHGQNAVRDDEQNHQQRQDGRRPRRCSRSYALSAINDGHRCPQLTLYVPGFMKDECTRETIWKGCCKCLLRMELVSRNEIGIKPRVQASALYE